MDSNIIWSSNVSVFCVFEVSSYLTVILVLVHQNELNVQTQSHRHLFYYKLNRRYYYHLYYITS